MPTRGTPLWFLGFAMAFNDRDRLKLKESLTPIWNREMGQRLRLVRMLTLRRQVDLAELLSTPEGRVHAQQIDKVERGWLDRLHVTWARLETVLGAHIGYVLTGKDAAYYENRKVRFNEHYQRAMRRRFKVDPKLGEAQPWPKHPTLEQRIHMDELDEKAYGPRNPGALRGSLARHTRKRGRSK